MDEKGILGILVKQAREEKGWSQQQLAKEFDTETEIIQELENGNGNPDLTTLPGYFFLLGICPDVAVYETDADMALKMDRLYRELQSLPTEQYERLSKSVTIVRRWKKNHPDVITLEDYWNAIEDETSKS